MLSTKMIIAIAAIAALALAAVGIAAAQIVQNQYYTSTESNTQSPNTGFWGWIGNCFGWTTPPQTVNQQVPAGPVQPAQPTQPNDTVPRPAPYAPYQGGYGYGNGYGYGYGYGCMGGW